MNYYHLCRDRMTLPTLVFIKSPSSALSMAPGEGELEGASTPVNSPHAPLITLPRSQGLSIMQLTPTQGVIQLQKCLTMRLFLIIVCEIRNNPHSERQISHVLYSMWILEHIQSYMDILTCTCDMEVERIRTFYQPISKCQPHFPILECEKWQFLDDCSCRLHTLSVQIMAGSRVWRCYYTSHQSYTSKLRLAQGPNNNGH